jgi:hypothetical protein
MIATAFAQLVVFSIDDDGRNILVHEYENTTQRRRDAR